MPGKRSTTPLFDLLQQRRPRGVEVRAPEVELERSQPAPPPRAPRAPGRFAEAPIRVVAGVIHMPLAYGAVALAVALAGVLASWTLGYRRGESHARADQAMLESLMGPESRITEPGESVDPGGGGTNQPANTRADSGGAGAPGAPPPFLTSTGGTSADPRRPRHNYLYLAAQLEAGSAESAIAHLKTRGIDAFAEIDPGTLRRKNGPLYSLIAGRGVPSGEADSPESTRYREQVLAAGTAWKQDGGKWDFADAYWRLHAPAGEN